MENKTEEFNIDDPKYYIVLQLVFRHLTFHELVNCELVCKKWMTISRLINAKHEHLSNEIKSIYNFSTGTWASIDKFSSFFSKVPNLKTFPDYSLFPNLDYFNRLFQLCPKLDHFQCWEFDYIEGLDYTKLGKLLNQKVNKLTIINMQRFDLFSSMISQMDQLEYFSCYELDDYNFIFKFKSLKTLNLLRIICHENCVNVVVGLVQHGINRTLNHITLCLNYGDNEISRKICLKLANHFPHLESLSLKNMKLFLPEKVNFLKLKEFNYYGPAFMFSFFNQNQLLNIKTLKLKFYDQITVKCIDGMSKVFPNSQNLTLELTNYNPNQRDNKSKMNLLKMICSEISKLVSLKKFTIRSTRLINLNDEKVCNEICLLIKQMENLNTIQFYLYELQYEIIMKMFIDLAKSQPKKRIFFPSKWITTQLTHEDIPRNLIINLSKS